MIKSTGSDATSRPSQNIFDIKSLESKSNTELLGAIDDMMALPAEEIDMDFVNECLDILQKRTPVMEDYDPMETLDKLQEEHPALFEIEDTPPVKATPAPRHSRIAGAFRRATTFVAVVLCLVVTANAFGYKPVQALFQWFDDTVQSFSNPSGLMNLPADDPSEYHSLDEALEANGLESAQRITWIPKDYALSRIRVSPRDKMLQIAAIYESERGDLAVRILTIDDADWHWSAESDFDGTEYTQNSTVYYISSNFDIMKAGWQDNQYSYEISGQISEEEIKKMIDSIT